MTQKSDEVNFYRDELGDLLPEKAKLSNEEEVYVIPLARGEVRKLSMLDGLELETYILTKKVKKPLIDETEVNRVKPKYVELLIKAVYEVSGIDTNKTLKENEDEFSLHLKKVRNERKDADLIHFLHKYNYTFFNIGKLTYSEINMLITAFNREQEQKNRSIKK